MPFTAPGVANKGNRFRIGPRTDILVTVQEPHLGICLADGSFPARPIFWCSCCREPVTIAGEGWDRLDVEVFDAATGMAPAGKGVIKAYMYKQNFV